MGLGLGRRWASLFVSGTKAWQWLVVVLVLSRPGRERGRYCRPAADPVLDGGVESPGVAAASGCGALRA
jgi:hypothetical protein